MPLVPGDGSLDEDRLPTISVVTPSYNQASFLEQTIRSVLDQAYPALEYGVLDAGSTDGSVEIIRRYEPSLAYWASAPDDGQASAINAGWRRSSGEIMGWLNSDDRYTPGTLALVGDFFRSNPTAAWCYGTAEFVDDRGATVGELGGPFDLRRLGRGDQMIPQASAFMRRTALDAVGLLDEGLRYGMDFDLFLRLARSSEPVFIDQRLSSVTLHRDAKTTRDRPEARSETFRIAARYATGLDLALLRLLALRAAAYHRLPSRLRRRLDDARGLPLI